MTNENDAAGSDPKRSERRDATAARMLGTFLLVLAVPVLAGAGFGEQPIDRWLSVGAALALAACGAGFWALARRDGRPRKP